MNTNWAALAPVLQGIMDQATESGEETGCQLAIYHHGELVVDLASGYYGPDRSRKVTGESLLPIFSCGKPVFATVMHRLVEKGLIGYDTRIGDIWPEFDCNGKEDIRLWQFMSHRAALHRMPTDISVEDQADWSLMCGKLAKATPAWKPGTTCSYHGVTYAWLMGEAAARAAGKDVREVIREELLQPLGLEGQFFWGITEEADRDYVPVDGSAMPQGPQWCGDFINNPVIRRGCIPSANAVTNARSLAKHYASLLGNGVGGVRLLKPETVEIATRLCRWEQDPIKPGDWALFGLGYALVGPAECRGRIFGQGGACGSEGFADQENDVAYAFTKNKDLPSHPVHPVRDRLSDALGIAHRIW